MGHFGSHFVFAHILNGSTLTKFQFSVWSSAMPKETESIKKKTEYLKTRFSSEAAGLYVRLQLGCIHTELHNSINRVA